VHAQAETLGASLQSQMTREGYPNLGVTVTDADDVYLVGAFPSQAERDRAIAMVRAHRSVRDIYFAGSVWYANRPEQPANAEDMETHLPAVRSSSPESAPPRQPSAEPTDYFPITAADVTPAPPPEVPTPAAAASTAMPDAAQSHADLWPLRHSNDSH